MLITPPVAPPPPGTGVASSRSQPAAYRAQRPAQHRRDRAVTSPLCGVQQCSADGLSVVGAPGYFIGMMVYVQQGTAGNIPLAAAFSVVPIVLIFVYLSVAKRFGAFDAL